MHDSQRGGPSWHVGLDQFAAASLSFIGSYVSFALELLRDSVMSP